MLGKLLIDCVTGYIKSNGRNNETLNYFLRQVHNAIRLFICSGWQQGSFLLHCPASDQWLRLEEKAEISSQKIFFWEISLRIDLVYVIWIRYYWKFVQNHKVHKNIFLFISHLWNFVHFKIIDINKMFRFAKNHKKKWINIR